MTLNLMEASEAAGRLMAMGLDAKRRPARDEEYRKLLRRYLDDQDFRTMVQGMAQGLGLLILAADVHGLALAAEETSPFAARLDDYRHNLTTETRLLHGMVQVGAVAYLYPTAEVLSEEDEVVRTISVQSLEKYLRGLCEDLAERHPQPSEDPTEETPELEQAWRLYHSHASARETADGRRAPNTTLGIIAQAFDALDKHGLFRKVSDGEGGTYQALRRYHLQAKELAGHEGYTLLVELSLRAGRRAEAPPEEDEGP